MSAYDELTDLQRSFYDAFFSEECGMNKYKAREMSLYSNKTMMHHILRGKLSEAMIENAYNMLASEAPQSVLKLTDIRDEKLAGPSASNALAACREILDRAGVVKNERMEIKQEIRNAIVLLPAKDEN
jgi:hypothetical protein